jgi:ArsR family transcriptional regulator
MPQSRDLPIIEIFKALGDLTRFRILKLISISGNNLCVSALSKKLNISQPVISQHLKVLKNAGIVTSRRLGNYIHYSINHHSIHQLKDQIDILMKISFKNVHKEKCGD